MSENYDREAQANAELQAELAAMTERAKQAIDLLENDAADADFIGDPLLHGIAALKAENERLREVIKEVLPELFILNGAAVVHYKLNEALAAQEPHTHE